MPGKLYNIKSKFNASLFGMVLFTLLVVAIFTKQLFVNLLSGNRHLVAGAIFVLAFVFIVSTIIFALFKLFCGKKFLYIPFRWLWVLHGVYVLYWIILIFISGGGNFCQRVISCSYAGGFSLVVWGVVFFLDSAKKLKYGIGLIVWATCLIAVIGALQWFIPESKWPGLLRGDSTVLLSGTLFGTVRSSGLIGTSLEFGLLMSIMAAYFFISLIRRISFLNIAGFVLMLAGVTFAGSRAFWLTVSTFLVLIAVFSGKRAVFILLCIIFIIISIKPLRDYYWIPFTTDRPDYVASVDIKVHEMDSAFEQIKSSPWVGTGIGVQLAPAFCNQPCKTVSDGFWWAILLEGGFLGLSLLWSFLLCVCVVFLRAFLSTRDGGSGKIKDLSKWGIALIGIAVMGNIPNSSLNNQSVNIAFYLMIGVVVAAVNLSFKEKEAIE